MTTLDIAERVEQHVRELAGSHSDEAWHSLVEIGPAALPYVVQAFKAAGDWSVAVSLIRIINEYRTQAALPFLVNLLADDDSHVWKAALDGIVTIGGSVAAEHLQQIRKTLASDKQRWIEEAVQQITGRGR
jgi:HEAT repeat protein